MVSIISQVKHQLRFAAGMMDYSEFNKIKIFQQDQNKRKFFNTEIELISWQVDLMRVGLVAIDLVRIILVKGSPIFISITSAFHL